MLFDSKIQGIPCTIEITSFGDFLTDNTFNVLTTKFKPAKWLEKKMTKTDYDQIYNDMDEALQLSSD